LLFFPLTNKALIVFPPAGLASFHSWLNEHGREILPFQKEVASLNNRSSPLFSKFSSRFSSFFHFSLRISANYPMGLGLNWSITWISWILLIAGEEENPPSA
jgi:hypothetical protein